jgi:HPt (histidine-containing phosphotransfer) domain-containing protein
LRNTRLRVFGKTSRILAVAEANGSRKQSAPPNRRRSLKTLWQRANGTTVEEIPRAGYSTNSQFKCLPFAALKHIHCQVFQQRARSNAKILRGFFVALFRPPELLQAIDLQGRRILIIDDNPTNCFILGETMSAWGIVNAEMGLPRSIRIEMPPGLEEIVPGYLADRQEDLPEMIRLLATSAFERLVVLGHNLKGSGTSYGFPELTRMGAALEQSAKLTDGGALSIQLNELQDYLDHVQLFASSRP